MARYGVNRVPVKEQLCETCNSVDYEFHVLMKCPLYRDASDICFNSISAVSEVFADLPQKSQFIELMSISTMNINICMIDIRTDSYFRYKYKLICD